MPFKRSQSQYNAIKFWQCISSGAVKLIRLACDGSSVISDLIVLRGGVNPSGAHRLFNLHFCKFLILLVNASGNWKRTKGASVITLYSTHRSWRWNAVFRLLKSVTSHVVFQIGLSGTPAAASCDIREKYLMHSWWFHAVYKPLKAFLADSSSHPCKRSGYCHFACYSRYGGAVRASG